MSHRPLRRALVAGAFAVCLALTPGTAWAEEDPATPALPPEVTDVLEGAETEDEQSVEQEEAAADETPPPAFAFPPEVVAALQQFAAQAGFPEDCVTGVVESLELIGNGIAGLPAELQQLLTDLGTAVQQQLGDPEGSALEDFLSGLVPAPPAEGSEEPPAPPIGADITTGLQQLADALQACQPAPPTEEPEPTDPPEQPVAGPAPHNPAPPPAAPQAPVQPAVYPGYAPTGAEQVDEAPSPVALGIALAFLAGSGVWASRRWRAAGR